MRLRCRLFGHWFMSRPGDREWWLSDCARFGCTETVRNRFASGTWG